MLQLKRKPAPPLPKYFPSAHPAKKKCETKAVVKRTSIARGESLIMSVSPSSPARGFCVTIVADRTVEEEK